MIESIIFIQTFLMDTKLPNTMVKIAYAIASTHRLVEPYAFDGKVSLKNPTQKLIPIEKIQIEMVLEFFPSKKAFKP